MVWVDYCILVLIIVSTIVGVIRGATRETLGLLTWILAFWLAVSYADPFTLYLEPYISAPSIRAASAYALLFLAGLLGGGIITALIVRGVRGSVFSSTDRTLGAGVGLIRGAFIVALLVLFVGMTKAREDVWFKQSLLIARFQVLADGLGTLLPAAWLEKFKDTARIEPPVLAPSEPGLPLQ